MDRPPLVSVDTCARAMAERKGVTTKSTILVPSSSVPSAVEGGCGLVVALFDLQQALCSTLSEIEVVIAIITSHQRVLFCLGVVLIMAISSSCAVR